MAWYQISCTANLNDISVQSDILALDISEKHRCPSLHQLKKNQFFISCSQWWIKPCVPVTYLMAWYQISFTANLNDLSVQSAIHQSSQKHRCPSLHQVKKNIFKYSLSIAWRHVWCLGLAENKIFKPAGQFCLNMTQY